MLSGVLAILPKGRKLVTDELEENLVSQSNSPESKTSKQQIGLPSMQVNRGLQLDLKPHHWVEVSDPGDKSVHGFILKSHMETIREYKRKQTLLSSVTASPRISITSKRYAPTNFTASNNLCSTPKNNQSTFARS